MLLKQLLIQLKNKLKTISVKAISFLMAFLFNSKFTILILVKRNKSLRMLKIGVAGAGHLGKIHIKILKEL